jgi:hypothetical protein
MLYMQCVLWLLQLQVTPATRHTGLDVIVDKEEIAAPLLYTRFCRTLSHVTPLTRWHMIDCRLVQSVRAQGT